MSTVTLPTRRRYDAALKLHAVRLVRDQRLSVRQVCEDLSIDDSCLQRWARQGDRLFEARMVVGTSSAQGMEVRISQSRGRKDMDDEFISMINKCCGAGIAYPQANTIIRA